MLWEMQQLRAARAPRLGRPAVAPGNQTRQAPCTALQMVYLPSVAFLLALSSGALTCALLTNYWTYIEVGQNSENYGLGMRCTYAHSGSTVIQKYTWFVRCACSEGASKTSLFVGRKARELFSRFG